MTKILVIEDEILVRENLLDLLEAENFQAIGAANGRRGVELAQEILPDLIICDVMMPELDGYDVLKTLQQNVATATIPFIFVTAKSDDTDLRQGMLLGSDDYLTKPYDLRELLQAITVRLQKHARLQQKTQQQLDTLRTSITLSMSPELRTPLDTIVDLSETLFSDPYSVSPEEIAAIATYIHTSANQVHHLIQDFLDRTHLELQMASQSSQDIEPNQGCHQSR